MATAVAAADDHQAKLFCVKNTFLEMVDAEADDLTDDELQGSVNSGRHRPRAHSDPVKATAADRESTVEMEETPSCYHICTPPRKHSVVTLPAGCEKPMIPMLKGGCDQAMNFDEESVSGYDPDDATPRTHATHLAASLGEQPCYSSKNELPALKGAGGDLPSFARAQLDCSSDASTQGGDEVESEACSRRSTGTEPFCRRPSVPCHCHFSPLPWDAGAEGGDRTSSPASPAPLPTALPTQQPETPTQHARPHTQKHGRPQDPHQQTGFQRAAQSSQQHVPRTQAHAKFGGRQQAAANNSNAAAASAAQQPNGLPPRGSRTLTRIMAEAAKSARLIRENEMLRRRMVEAEQNARLVRENEMLRERMSENASLLRENMLLRQRMEECNLAALEVFNPASKDAIHKGLQCKGSFWNPSPAATPCKAERCTTSQNVFATQPRNVSCQLDTRLNAAVQQPPLLVPPPVAALGLQRVLPTTAQTVSLAQSLPHPSDCTVPGDIAQQHAFAKQATTIENPPFEDRSTVMMRNLPNNYSRAMLLKLLDDEGFAARYDFIYLPIDFKSSASLGYAFVNLCTPLDAEAFWEHFEGFSSWAVPSRKVCGVNWSGPHQGLALHIKRYQNSPVMHEAVPDECKPAIFMNGLRAPFPSPSKKIRAPRVRHYPGGTPGGAGASATAAALAAAPCSSSGFDAAGDCNQAAPQDEEEAYISGGETFWM